GGCKAVFSYRLRRGELPYAYGAPAQSTRTSSWRYLATGTADGNCSSTTRPPAILKDSFRRPERAHLGRFSSLRSPYSLCPPFRLSRYLRPVDADSRSTGCI